MWTHYSDNSSFCTFVWDNNFTCFCFQIFPSFEDSQYFESESSESSESTEENPSLNEKQKQYKQKVSAHSFSSTLNYSCREWHRFISSTGDHPPALIKIVTYKYTLHNCSSDWLLSFKLWIFFLYLFFRNRRKTTGKSHDQRINR